MVARVHTSIGARACGVMKARATMVQPKWQGSIWGTGSSLQSTDLSTTSSNGYTGVELREVRCGTSVMEANKQGGSEAGG